MKIFRKIAVLGGGLLGGSLALALQDSSSVVVWARRKESVASAIKHGVKQATYDLQEAIADADLIILCVPVGAMPSLIKQAIEGGLGPATLVTDVGSVKRIVHHGPGRLLKDHGIPFIGGHPMAGSEQRGVEASSGDLFEKAVCFLTDDDEVGRSKGQMLEDLWRGLGCRVVWTSAEKHDRIVAKISHFPHLMAAAAAAVALNDPIDAAYGGGGLRDTTRVAGGDAEMWAEILMENRTAVSDCVSNALRELTDVHTSLKAGDHRAVHKWLLQAQEFYKSSRPSRTTSQAES